MIRIEWWRSPVATGVPLGRGRRSKPRRRTCRGRSGTAADVAAVVVVVVAGVVAVGGTTLDRECSRHRPADFAAVVVVGVVVAVAVVAAAAAAAVAVDVAVALRVLPPRTTTLGIRRVRAWAIEGRRSGPTSVRAHGMNEDTARQCEGRER